MVVGRTYFPNFPTAVTLFHRYHAPDEPGGALRGFQFQERVFRLNRRRTGEAWKEHLSSHMEMMHSQTREKGLTTRRTYFVEQTVTRFAERVGWPRQRVMSQFLDDGIIDWLLRTVESVPTVVNRDTETLLTAKVNQAVSALEFYYRAVEKMRYE